MDGRLNEEGGVLIYSSGKLANPSVLAEMADGKFAIPIGLAELAATNRKSRGGVRRYKYRHDTTQKRTTPNATCVGACRLCQPAHLPPDTNHSDRSDRRIFSEIVDSAFFDSRPTFEGKSQK